MDNCYKNIKAAVFWSQYGLLIIGGAIMIVVAAGAWPSFSIYPLLGMILGVVFRTLFVQARYVTGFHMKERILHITYITPFFTKGIYRKYLEEITDIQMDGGKLNIVTTGKWETFDVPTKKIKRDIEAKIQEANLGFKKARQEYNKH